MGRSSVIRLRLNVVALVLALAPAGSGQAQTSTLGAIQEITGASYVNPQCPRVITQADIDANRPYVISQPGRYCLVEDIQVSYATSGNTTIAIRASDVTLLFRGYSLTELNGRERHTTAISVVYGTRNVVIAGGTIRGFRFGVSARGWWVLKWMTPTGVAERYFERPIVGVQVSDMHLTGMWDTGVELQVVLDSTVQRCTFDDSSIGVSLTGNVTGTEVRDNDFTLGNGTLPFRTGVYGDAPYSAVVRNNTFTGNGQLPPQAQQYGVVIWNGYATTALMGHNLVEDNVFIQLRRAIYLSGNGRAPSNVIRSNRIYGETPTSLYMGPLTNPSTAIRIGDNEGVTVNANVIHSGPVVGYHYGIYLTGGTTVSTQANGLPGVYDNETCNVDVNLDPISADGGNFWDACNLPQP
jgi:hypothetical protein